MASFNLNFFYLLFYLKIILQKIMVNANGVVEEYRQQEYIDCSKKVIEQSLFHLNFNISFSFLKNNIHLKFFL